MLMRGDGAPLFLLEHSQYPSSQWLNGTKAPDLRGLAVVVSASDAKDAPMEWAVITVTVTPGREEGNDSLI